MSFSSMNHFHIRFPDSFKHFFRRLDSFLQPADIIAEIFAEAALFNEIPCISTTMRAVLFFKPRFLREWE